MARCTWASRITPCSAALSTARPLAVNVFAVAVSPSSNASSWGFVMRSSSRTRAARGRALVDILGDAQNLHAVAPLLFPPSPFAGTAHRGEDLLEAREHRGVHDEPVEPPELALEVQGSSSSALRHAACWCFFAAHSLTAGSSRNAMNDPPRRHLGDEREERGDVEVRRRRGRRRRR